MVTVDPSTIRIELPPLGGTGGAAGGLRLPPAELGGGGAGAPGNMHLRHGNGETEDAPKYGLRRTDNVRFVTQSPGGGGYGPALERAPEHVLRDWRDEIISEATMRDVYGVVAASDGKSVDADATAALRGTMMAAE